jgi:hypothetical protein
MLRAWPIVAGLVLMVTAPACPASDWLYGKLLFGWEGRLTFLDLRSLKTSTAYDEEMALPPRITKVSDTQIVYTSQVDRLSELDLETKMSKELGRGDAPTYVPEHKKIFFVSGGPNHSRPVLYLADIANPRETATVVEKGPYAIGGYVIQVGPDEVVFPGFGESAGIVWHYNIVNRELGTLRMPKNCVPVLWRSRTKQLVCFDSKDKGYLLTDLKGERIEYVEGLKGTYAVLYIGELDVMIYGKTAAKFFPPERKDLYAYSFASGESSLLMKGAHVYNGNAVYISKRSPDAMK